MADIVLKDRNGNDVAYEGIKTVTFDTTTEGEQATFTEGVAVEGLEIVPDFSGGDMAITAPEGTLVKSATIKKPDALSPENIRNGVEVGGVSGTFIGDTEEQSVALTMADGDMVVEPSAAGKVLSKVTIQKPETLIPENIAEGVDIGGIIGTFAGGGDPPKLFMKQFKANANTYAGIVTIATAEELDTIGFSEGNRRFAMILCAANDQIGMDSTFYSVMFNLITSWSFTMNGTAGRNCLIAKNRKSGSYSNAASTELIYKNAFSGNTIDDSIFYQDGEIRYNADSATNSLKSYSTGYVEYVFVAGVLS